MIDHLDEQIITEFFSDTLNNEQRLFIENHVHHCERCRKKLEESAADVSLWDEASQLLSDDWNQDIGESVDLRDLKETPAESKAKQVALVTKLLAPTDDPRSMGRFGTYEILGVIGFGGMGIVLKALDPSLNRFVALKLLSPHLAMNATARQRFAREAQAAAAVIHENVIEIYGVSEFNGLPFFVMPLVRGSSLQRRIETQGALRVSEILRIGLQTANGLAAAHAQGLVHRDIKPANILLMDGVERVKITDFGLARAVDDASLTCTGLIAGTPQYMSPEQARGEVSDFRSDLFSLGSVMYAMATGRPPFRAETTYGVLRCITDQNPRSIREQNPEIPVWLAEVIERLQSKDREQRFQTAAEVAEVLAGLLAQQQHPQKMPLPISRVIPPPKIHHGTTASKRHSSAWASFLIGFVALMIIVPVLVAGTLLLSQSRQQQKATPTAADPVNLPSITEAPADNWSEIESSLEKLEQNFDELENSNNNFWK